jgi:hypothetical protein
VLCSAQFVGRGVKLFGRVQCNSPARAAHTHFPVISARELSRNQILAVAHASGAQHPWATREKN